MRNNMVKIGALTIIFILLFSSRFRKTIRESMDGEALNKACELKNVLSDWKKNQKGTSYE
ncbi:hypothetical protein J2S78_002969 [Salibacterium salarium]|uniref:hypothetical protein n=1 Tax=Salibacterium salarium TaxID=284579 RepID=UPI002785FAAD|nr:hypothetical protein [Salibacterium salarium]MDQ0300501.1 hypothetical protein [Salibacterium salarium]